MRRARPDETLMGDFMRYSQNNALLDANHLYLNPIGGHRLRVSGAVEWGIRGDLLPRFVAPHLGDVLTSYW
jgi:hypothetical protein